MYCSHVAPFLANPDDDWIALSYQKLLDQYFCLSKNSCYCSPRGSRKLGSDFLLESLLKIA